VSGSYSTVRELEADDLVQLPEVPEEKGKAADKGKAERGQG
jgi:hypothetical protein